MCAQHPWADNRLRSGRIWRDVKNTDLDPDATRVAAIWASSTKRRLTETVSALSVAELFIRMSCLLTACTRVQALVVLRLQHYSKNAVVCMCVLTYGRSVSCVELLLHYDSTGCFLYPVQVLIVSYRHYQCLACWHGSMLLERLLPYSVMLLLVACVEARSMSLHDFGVFA